MINQGLVGCCYLWGLWAFPPLRFPVFTFGIELSLRQICGGWGGTDGCRKNRSTLNLKPLKLLVFIKSTNLIGYGALSKILLHQFTKPPRRPRRGGRRLVLHFINMLLDSLCRRTLRKGLSSVRNAKRCSAPPSLYSVIFSSTIVSITIYVSIRLLKHC